VLPPAEKGTSSVLDLVGYPACANASVDTKAAAADVSALAAM